LLFSSYRSGGLNIWRTRISPENIPWDHRSTAGRQTHCGFTQTSGIFHHETECRHLADAAGSPNRQPKESREIITTTREDSRGAWSPDGGEIAFNSDRNGEMNLWLFSFRDRSVRQVTKGSGGDFQPNWCPDKRQIAFFSSRAGDPDIWTLDCETGAVHQLTNKIDQRESVLFTDRKGCVPVGSNRRPEVW
jgi:hypothetical protein